MGCRGGSCWKTSISPGRSTTPGRIALPTGDLVRPLVGGARGVCPQRRVLEQAEVWRQIVRTPAALPAVQPERDTFATAGRSSVTLDAEITRQVLGEVPAAFHAGVQDILLIAFGLAWAEFWAPGPRRSASTSRSRP